MLLLSGASGAYALFMVQGKDEEKRAPAVSGLACTTVETLKMRRNGQRWIRKYITVEKGSGEERVRTALRVAGLLVHLVAGRGAAQVGKAGAADQHVGRVRVVQRGQNFMVRQ